MFYYLVEDRVVGPFTESEMLMLRYTSKVITDETLVCAQGTKSWESFASAFHLSIPLPAVHARPTQPKSDHSDAERPDVSYSHTYKPTFQGGTASTITPGQSFDLFSGNGCTVTAFIVVLFTFLLTSNCTPDSTSTDGVFESATEKLDRGEELNEAEKKRLNDILFDERWDGDK